MAWLHYLWDAHESWHTCSFLGMWSVTVLDADSVLLLNCRQQNNICACLAFLHSCNYCFPLSPKQHSLTLTPIHSWNGGSVTFHNTRCKLTCVHICKQSQRSKRYARQDVVFIPEIQKGHIPLCRRFSLFWCVEPYPAVWWNTFHESCIIYFIVI